jgi:DNA-binding NarL/FixJ family response regulator
MDIRLPGGNGVQACREIREEMPDTRVIMLTSYADDEALFGSIMAGASGYMLKQVRGQNLAEAIEKVASGESLLDPAVTSKVLERMRGLAAGGGDELAALSPQERKILTLIAEGKTNKEIAAEVFLSDKTVKNYVSSILSKLNLRRRSEAAAFIAERKARRLD